ncbi:MAG: hypothetical protein ACOYXB_16920 [Bacteroidota bacterium]
MKIRTLVTAVAILPMVLFLLNGCEKETVEFTYDHKITRSYRINEYFGDSLIYYYDSGNKLLKVDRYYTSDYLAEYYITYGENWINNWNGFFRLDSAARIYLIENYGSLLRFTYDSGKIVYSRQTISGYTVQENFFEYLDDNIIKDSTLIYQDNYQPAVTVYHYTYTDTLKPDYMVDYSGLFEMPESSKNLIREASSPENNILYRYYYDIMDNQIIQYSEFWDLTVNEKKETIRTLYRLEGE